MKQGQYSPQPLQDEVGILYAVVNGFMDEVPIEKCAAFESAFHSFMRTNHPEIGKSITDTEDISPENEEALKRAIEEFKQSVPY